MSTDAELRAKIHELMASGVLSSESPSIARRGSTDAGGRARVAVVNPLPEPCSICGDPGPQIALFYTAGRAVRLHAACDALWQQERHTS